MAVEEPGEKWYRTYMGGSTFISYYLLNSQTRNRSAVTGERPDLCLQRGDRGALSGWNRYTIAAKSPLTHAFGESEAGGYFGPELKFAGFDAIVIRDGPPNRSSSSSRTERSSSGTRRISGGWTIFKPSSASRSRAGGQAGAGGVDRPGRRAPDPLRQRQNDVEHFNGRTGMGAVMGSKNLKAVAVRGTQKLEMAEPEKVKEIARWHNDRIKTHPPNVGLTKFGTTGLVKGINDGGILPTRNFQEGVFEGADKLSRRAYPKPSSTRTAPAGPAPSGASAAWSSRREVPARQVSGGPEYETIAAFGSMMGIDNLPAVARGNQLCNLYGMDTITMGDLTAFVMECFENGILTEKDTGGRTLQFGDPDAMLWLIEEIASRRGSATSWPKGFKRASEKIGRGSEQFAFTIKGNDLPFHDGRGKTGMAMGYALSPTGADHVETPHDVAFQGDGVSKLYPMGLFDPVDPLKTDSAKIRFFSIGQKAWGINNLLSLCNFTSVPIHAMTFGRLVEAVNAITGWDTSLYELVNATERSNVMARVFNNREGFTPKDDTLISRWFEEMPGGPLKGKRIDPEVFRDLVQLYYEMSGWDAQGRPTRGKLVELGLYWLLDN